MVNVVFISNIDQVFITFFSDFSEVPSLFAQFSSFCLFN